MRLTPGRFKQRLIRPEETSQKLRGSWGEVGNEAPIGLFQYQSLYAGNFPSNVNGGGLDNLGYPFNKIYQAGIAATSPENPNLRWETDYQTDIDADMAALPAV